MVCSARERPTRLLRCRPRTDFGDISVVGSAQGGQRGRDEDSKTLRKREKCRPFRRSIPPIATMASEKLDFCDSAAGQVTRILLPEFVLNGQKKSPAVLNVGQPFGYQYLWERFIPPRSYIWRERPSTPSAPYGLTRPVVPPGGSFISGRLATV
jgi:hypothetical protein